MHPVHGVFPSLILIQTTGRLHRNVVVTGKASVPFKAVLPGMFSASWNQASKTYCWEISAQRWPDLFLEGGFPAQAGGSPLNTGWLNMVCLSSVWPGPCFNSSSRQGGQTGLECVERIFSKRTELLRRWLSKTWFLIRSYSHVTCSDEKELISISISHWFCIFDI